MSDETNHYGPGWAVFMTQNMDRPFARALMCAVDLARARQGRGHGHVTWSDLLDEGVVRQLVNDHGADLARRVQSVVRAQCASAGRS